MPKCPICNSCLRFATVGGVMYLFCSLCWKVYIKTSSGIDEVTKEDTKNYLVAEIKKQIGTTIIL
jgi:hypothetical protein